MMRVTSPTPSRHVAGRMPLLMALLVAIGAGALFDLAFASAGIWPLAFVGVGLSLWTLIGRSGWGAIAVGGAFAATFYLLHIDWITRYLGVVPWFALAGVETVISAVLSVPIALAYRWWPQRRTRGWAGWFGLPAVIAGLWTTREIVLGSWPYTGFPWGRVGMSQSESPLAHLASWIGVTGLTFAMVFAAAAAVEWIRAGRRAGIRPLAPIGVAAVLLLLVPQFPTTDSGNWRIGAVQGNGPAAYFDQREPLDVLRSQLEATRDLDGPVDLVVWPEGGIDADPTANTSVAAVLGKLSERLDAPLLVNAATTRGEDIYNTSMLWEPGATAPAALHDKTHPVPMGEYVPDRWFFEMLAPDLIGLIQREYTPGTNAPFVDVDGVGVGLAICFDVIYDDVIWAGARDGAEVFVFQTNNADFRGTDENVQQLAFARMRAIETGRSVVNVSTTGASQAIAPDGTELASIRADTAGVFEVDVPLRTGLTAAVVIGPVVQWLIVTGSLTAVVWLGALRWRDAKSAGLEVRGPRRRRRSRQAVKR